MSERYAFIGKWESSDDEMRGGKGEVSAETLMSKYIVVRVLMEVEYLNMASLKTMMPIGRSS